ncbi:MAG: histidine kinase [Bacteroidota bacterium]
MEKQQKSPFLYFLLSAVPVFALISVVILHIIHQEMLIVFIVTFFFTLAYLGLLYAGRAMVRIWFADSGSISKKVLLQFACFLLGDLVAMIFTVQLRPANGVPPFLMFILLFLLFSFALGMLIKMAQVFIREQVQVAERQAAQSRAELRLLQDQLSPHFLFNTLNNLYGIAIAEHEKMPALLLKLSELLRYAVYEAKELYVPLTDELAYLHNYITFEQLRLGERLNLETDITTISDTNLQIPPLLLIVFVENAFKHSKDTRDEKIFISISLKLWEGAVLFSVKNSFGSEAIPENPNGGLGLVNVKKRLELLYPGRYDLSISTGKEQFYTVHLRLTPPY